MWVLREEVGLEHVDAIARYMAYGVDHGCGRCIGMELEHFMVTKEGQRPVAYDDDPQSGAPGVRRVLERLRPLYRDVIIETQPDGSENLIGLSREYCTITLEPGAQFEISMGPVWELGDLYEMYRRFRVELDAVLDEFGYELVELGYHPVACARDIPLIPKNRYRFMDEYFRDTGQHGICMMRATASTQVSIDYTSLEDAVSKFRVATALTPLFAFITDNSPVFEGQRVGRRELGPTHGSGRVTDTGLVVPYRMTRTAVWDDVDAQRCMTAPGVFEDGFGFERYAAEVLRGAAIFSVEHNEWGEKRSVQRKGLTFEEVFSGRELDCADVEHILSLYFYDVRFKTYIEIRAADSLPFAYALAYAALVKGLFYEPGTVGALAARFAGLDAAAVARAKRALCEEGFEAVVYGMRAAEWLDELMGMAKGALEGAEAEYLEPLAALIEGRRTLVDEGAC